MKIKALAVVAVAALALVAAGSSMAASRNILMEVLINDQGIRLAVYQNTQIADITELAATPHLLRGDDVHVVIYNRGHHSHSFTVFGKSTGTIKAGGDAKFELTAKHGTFRWGSTMDTARPFHGTLKVV